MNKDFNISVKAPLVEFSLESDRFIKARQKGARAWIIAHLLDGPNKYILFIAILTTIIAAILASATMVIVGMAVNSFIDGDRSTLLFFTIIILLLGIGTPLVRIGNFMLREILAQRMERDAREEFFVNLLGKSQSFHDQQKIGDLMARANEDSRMLNYLVSPAVSLIIESFTSLIIPLIFILLFFPPQLVLAPIIFVILFFFALRVYIRKLGPVTGRMRFTFGEMNIRLNESLTGIELVKSSTQEQLEKQKYFETAKNYREAYVEQGRIQAKYYPILMLALTMTFGLAHAIFLYNLKMISIGQIIAYLGLLSLLRMPTFISMFVFAIIKLAHAGAERMLEVMNTETEIDENLEGKTKEIEGKIKFENVSFTYPGYKKPVLKNISFEIEKGQTIAIVGTTGSGKTTLTKLISRLYDVNDGKILIDGVDIRNFALFSLRSQISYIEQDVFLFSDSIINNISFGRISSMEKIINATKQAQAHDFISEFPDSYESKVGERGVQLSGGERQRIAIARAFLTNPKILILDDSTSAIDSETEDKIQKAISNILKDRSTILITHRLSQIRWADLIIVLKRGEIAAKGTHTELLKTSEDYQNIFIKKFDIDINRLLPEGT